MRAIRRDDGFSLTELLVVMALMGLVLSVAWSAMAVTRNGSEQSEREAVFSQEVGAPLDMAERLLSQQFALNDVSPGCGPYRCAFYTDRDTDGHREAYVIEVNSAGEFITRVAEEVDAPAVRTGVWSDRNANVSSGTPLFRYLDHEGNEITSVADIYAKARSVDVTIVARLGDRSITDTRRVYFRNR